MGSQGSLGYPKILPIWWEILNLWQMKMFRVFDLQGNFWYIGPKRLICLKILVGNFQRLVPVRKILLKGKYMHYAVTAVYYVINDK